MPSSLTTLKNRFSVLAFFFATTSLFAQNNTFTPYSRYGLGEMAPATFAHNQAMGGAFVALKPDSTMPVFINAGNPASYSLLRFTSLEVGGRYLYSGFRSANTGLRKWSTNFSYGSLGFPMGRRAGAAFGIMPYSSVGYDSQSFGASQAGDLKFTYQGSGGMNKAFLGYGIAPFSGSLNRFRLRYLSTPDSLRISSRRYKAKQNGYKLLSDLSLGVHANYIFGNVQHSARAIYPSGIIYNNTYSERSYFANGFTANMGIQGGFTFDSIGSGKSRRALQERTKITFGYFLSPGGNIHALTNSAIYNFIYNSAGTEIVRDTVRFVVDQPGSITLPVTHAFGIGFKKGERLNVVADVAMTDWNVFDAPHSPGFLQKSYRFAAGMNYVPSKDAAGRGAFFQKSQYRLGFSYETGALQIAGINVTTWMVSAGLGLPVGIGRSSSMVHLSLQAGQTGTTKNDLVRENFVRLHFGFTFCDRWFQKFRYD